MHIYALTKYGYFGSEIYALQCQMIEVKKITVLLFCRSNNFIGLKANDRIVTINSTLHKTYTCIYKKYFVTIMQ